MREHGAAAECRLGGSTAGARWWEKRRGPNPVTVFAAAALGLQAGPGARRAGGCQHLQSLGLRKLWHWWRRGPARPWGTRPGPFPPRPLPRRLEGAGVCPSVPPGSRESRLHACLSGCARATCPSRSRGTRGVLSDTWQSSLSGERFITRWESFLPSRPEGPGACVRSK